jgi:peroxiredoxin Q/BCP
MPVKKKKSAKKIVRAAVKAKPAKKKIAAKKTPKKPVAKSAAPKAKAASGFLKTGDRAPDFSLADDTGRTVSLADFRGKKLVVYFYPKDFTGGCTQESCDFRDNLNRIAASRAALVGVSADSVDSHRRFKEKHGLNFPLLSDPDRKMIGAYGVWQMKSLYGREFMGIVRTTYVVDEKGVIAKVFAKVKVQGHVAAVLAAL